MWFTALRKIDGSNRDTVRKEWKLGVTKKWFTYLRAYGKGRWTTDETRQFQGQGIGPFMELKIADDNGRLPRLERAVRKPKVIRVEK
jgi:hypothetical protein